MKATVRRRLQLESLELRTLLSGAPVDGALSQPVDHTPCARTDNIAEISFETAGAEPLPMAQAAKAQAVTVERTFHMKTTSQAVVSLADGSFHAQASGDATHVGQFAIHGWGHMNPETGESTDAGVITAGNGDLIFYHHENGTVTLVSGTGRFEEVSGGFTTVPEVVGEPIVDPVAGTVTMNFVWEATGTIAYQGNEDRLPGDADGDGQVQFTDFQVLAENFGNTFAMWEYGDFDGDGTVQFSDFVILANNFGKSQQG